MGRKARYYFSLQELQRKALDSWRTHAAEYRNLLPRYQSLLAKKRWLKDHERGYKSMPLRKINKTLLEEFVKIPFFDIETEDEALDYIYELDYSELSCLLSTINNALEDRAYRTIRSRIGDYEYEIKNFKRKKYLGYDPTYPISSGHRPRGSGRHSSLDE